MAADIPPDPEIRHDAWASTGSYLGSVRDKSVGVFFQRRTRLDQSQINNLYVQNATAAKIVDRIVDDALRERAEILNVKDRAGNPIEIDREVLQSKLDDLGVYPQLRRAGKWARKDGGALVLLPIWDDQDPDQPAIVKRGTPIGRLGVVPAERAQPGDQDGGIFSSTYGRVLEYLVSGITSTDGSVRVHHSRCIPIETIDLPLEQAQTWGGYTGWGPSILERVIDDLARDGSTAQHTVSMLYVSSILYTKLGNWRAEHTTKAGKARCREVIQEIRENLDSYGIIGLDPADEIGTIERTLAGLADLMDKFRDRVAAAAGMPREILFNESPNGLRGGELSGAQAVWFATVRQYQQDVITPILDRILEVVFASLGIKAWSWQIDWPELWTPDDASEADTYKKRAEADQLYMNMEVVGADEIRSKRFEENASGGMTLDERTEDPAAEAAPSAEPVPDDMISVQEAAAKFALKTRTLTRLMELGKLKYWSFNGKRQVSMADVRALGKEHETL